VIDYRAELDKRGLLSSDDIKQKNTFLVCPFHPDTDPSLSVSLEGGQFKCFGCQEKGNFYKLIAALDGITEKEARRMLKEEETVEQALASIERDLNSLQDEKLLYYNKVSFHKKFVSFKRTEGEKYLWKRKIKSSVMRRFDIRYGGEDGKWRHRVIFPIYTVEGKLLAWTGRVVNNDKPKTRKNKAARSTLYGLYELIQNKPKWMLSRFKAPVMFVVEGEIDAIYLQQFGLHAVSAMGTAGLSSRQTALVMKYADRVALCYDADFAGKLATYGNKKRVGDYDKLKELLPTAIIRLPKEKDPNNLSIRQVEKLTKKFS